MKTSGTAVGVGLILLVLASSTLAIELLVDSDFSVSTDSNDLQANSPGQDWYESRQDLSSSLALDHSLVGSNASAKAKLTESRTRVAYLTQQFNSPQTQTFSAQWDIYVDSILDAPLNPDRAAWMLIGDVTGIDPNRIGPNAEDRERFVYMAFYKDHGGTTGPMELVARQRDDPWTAFTTVATGLTLKQWYTIRVDLDLVRGTYDVYVNGLYKRTLTSRTAKDSVTHISFAQWADGPGTFYVDNVTARSTVADTSVANKIKYEWWLNIGGANVAALTSNPRYPNSPDGSILVAKFQSPVDWADNYGQRLSGWLKPPQTGNYTFWIAGDDEQQLWLSTDTSAANGVLIANVPGWTSALEWTKYPSQKSALIPLKAGEKYFIMALGKEGGGGDSTAVAWQGPGIAAREVIDAKYVDQFARRPRQAFNPDPANGERQIPSDLTRLSWSAGEGAKFHDVYFGTDPTLGPGNYKGRVSTTAFPLPPLALLAPGETYYWCVDEVLDGGTIVRGMLWHFVPGGRRDVSWSIGVAPVEVMGYVRDILDGHPISSVSANGKDLHNVIFQPTDGSRSCHDDSYPYDALWDGRPEGFYILGLWPIPHSVTVQAAGYKTDYPGFSFASRDQGRTATDTMRDFLLWPTSAPGAVHPVYRFLSPDQSKYYLTADESERDRLLYDDYELRDTWSDPRDPDNWTYDGIAFCGVAKGAQGALPVDKWWHATFGHCYTIRGNQNTHTKPNGPNWVDMGEAFYAYSQNVGNTSPVYHLTSAGGFHTYVLNDEEKKQLTGKGWTVDPTIAWWAYKRPTQ